jgi:hypothetical protein
MLKQNRVQTSTVLMRRPVLEELGGFDESLEAWEDVDLWTRTAERYLFAYVPEVLASYRMNGNGLSSRTMAMALGRLASVKKIVDGPANGGLRADAYAQLGSACYLESEMAAARRWLARAWRTDVTSLLRGRSVETFLKSLAGPWIIGSLRKRLRAAV